MKKLLFLVIPAFLFAEISDTPPKLRAFIETNIGVKNFFMGSNADKSEIVVRKAKDWSYYSFDLYKSIEMSIGVRPEKGGRAKHLRLDGQSYTLRIIHETVTDGVSGAKTSAVVFLFTK